MVAALAGVFLPVLLIPVLIYGLRHCFAWFLRVGADTFVDHEFVSVGVLRLGTTLACANAVLLVIVWMLAFAMILLELPYIAAAGVAALGILLGLWISIKLVEHRSDVRGTEATLLGMIAFAGGNLPLIILSLIVLLVL